MNTNTEKNDSVQNGNPSAQHQRIGEADDTKGMLDTDIPQAFKHAWPIFMRVAAEVLKSLPNHEQQTLLRLWNVEHDWPRDCSVVPAKVFFIPMFFGEIDPELAGRVTSTPDGQHLLVDSFFATDAPVAAMREAIVWLFAESLTYSYGELDEVRRSILTEELSAEWGSASTENLDKWALSARAKGAAHPKSSQAA